jgi:predicted nucleic acid-binding protein
MKVVFDSNIVIDALKPNVDFEMDAKHVFQLILLDKITPYICANSLTDIFYILQKIQGAEKAKNAIAKLIIAFNVIPLTEEDCSDALALPMNDFEDAIIAVCAQKSSADIIISRDVKFLNTETVVDVITPKQLLEKINTA